MLASFLSIWRDFMMVKLAMRIKLIVIFALVCIWQTVFATETMVELPGNKPNIQATNNTIQSASRVVQLPLIEMGKIPGSIPAPPDFDVKADILIDANSGSIIAEKNATQHLAPASLTKVMSLYLIADALSSGRLHPTDMVTVSENAWRTGGSRMFIKVGTSVSVKDLISGIATASGNDATVAMAEHLVGSEPNFVTMMNQTAHALGMNDTNFADSNGFSDVQHNYSSAKDLAILSRAWIKSFPEYYPWFKEQWITYNGIKQANRNRLLWRDPTVDGIKTGRTDEAGYCLIVSAERNNMRLISVVLGAKSEELRNKYSEALLNYGFRFFETRKLFAANTSLITPRVWLGKQKTMALGLRDAMYVTLPTGQHANLKAQVKVDDSLKAPIKKGQTCGTLNIMLDGSAIVSQPLVALKDNPRTNFVFALYDRIIMMFKH
jgi:serine-type D-Ala-D-Ala carboxypeptidase (penicillin-binding protein 5/6)